MGGLSLGYPPSGENNSFFFAGALEGSYFVKFEFLF